MPWYYIALKDLRITLRDRNGWIISLLLPVIVTLIAGFALGGMFTTEESPALVIRIPVVNHDEGEMGKEFVKALQSVKEFAIELTEDEAAARASVQSGDRGAMLIIPSGFSANLAAGTKTALTVVENPQSKVARLAVKQAADVYVQRLMGETGAHRAAMGGLQVVGRPADPAAVSQAVSTAVREYWASEPVGVQVVSTVANARPALNPFGQYVPGFAVMFLLFTVSKGAVSILKEKQGGTLRRIMAAPVGQTAILGGKLAANFLEGLVQVSILIVFGRLVFNVSWGDSFAGLALLVVATTAAATCLGLLMAALFRTPKQLDAVGTLIVLGMSALGGSWWPLEIVPDWMRALAKITITAWAMEGFHELIWYGGNLASVMPHVAALLLFAAGFFAVAVTVFRREAV